MAGVKNFWRVACLHIKVENHLPTIMSDLPVDVLGLIMVMVARSPRSPRAIAIDLLNAASASKAMRDAAADGFAELGRLCPGIGFGFDYRDPMAATVYDLRCAACVLGLDMDGSKEAIAGRIYNRLNLKAPPFEFVPLSVVKAVADDWSRVFQ